MGILGDEGLLDCLDKRECLKLPLEIMRECGPAVQTFGGLLSITKTRTYSATDKIAEAASLPPATCKKHLATLAAAGWIKNLGHERTASGRPRRTNTIEIEPKALKALKPYGLLPLWACRSPLIFKDSEGWKKLTRPMPWCAKALLSYLMGHLALHRAGFDKEGNWDPGEIKDMDAIKEEIFWEFSLDELEKKLGLSRPSITKAKVYLARLEVIVWTVSRGVWLADSLRPNPNFRVIPRRKQG